MTGTVWGGANEVTEVKGESIYLQHLGSHYGYLGNARRGMDLHSIELRTDTTSEN